MNHVPAAPAQAPELAELLYRLTKQLVAHMTAETAALDLTVTEYGALRTLREPMPMRMLADSMGIDPSTLTSVADRLEERGLIERRPHPTDRRVKQLALTPAGERLRTSGYERLRASNPVLQRLDGQEAAQLHALLMRALPDGG